MLHWIREKDLEMNTRFILLNIFNVLITPYYVVNTSILVRDIRLINRNFFPCLGSFHTP